MIKFVAKDFWTAQKKVAELIKGRILVGHALQNDLKVCIFCGYSLSFSWFAFIFLLSVHGDAVYRTNSWTVFLQALLLSHPKKDIRDTSEYQPFLKCRHLTASFSCYVLSFHIPNVSLIHYMLINLPLVLSRSGSGRALRHLAAELLGAKIQTGEHCPVSLSNFLVLALSSFILFDHLTNKTISMLGKWQLCF